MIGKEIECDGYVGKVIGEPFVANEMLYIPVIDNKEPDKIKFQTFEIGSSIPLWVNTEVFAG